jgi:hypothetical protein
MVKLPPALKNVKGGMGHANLLDFLDLILA